MHCGVFYISDRRRSPSPKRRGARGNLRPYPTPPFRRACKPHLVCTATVFTISAAFVLHQANDAVYSQCDPSVVHLRYHTVWSDISSYCVLAYPLQQYDIYTVIKNVTSFAISVPYFVRFCQLWAETYEILNNTFTQLTTSRFICLHCIW